MSSIYFSIKPRESLQLSSFNKRLLMSLERNNDVGNIDFTNLDIVQLNKLENNIKQHILVDYLASNVVNSEQIQKIIIIAIQYLFQKEQIELSIDALNKSLQINEQFGFFIDKELFEQLIALINIFNQNGNVMMTLKCVSLINVIVKIFAKKIFLNAKSILFDIMHSSYPQILLKCDMKYVEVSQSFWYLLKIQFNEFNDNDKVYSSDQLKLIFSNCINVLDFFLKSKGPKNQFDKRIKYLLKCISICPPFFNLDCTLVDIIISFLLNHPSYQIRNLALITAIKRNIKSERISVLSFEQIKFLISEETKGEINQAHNQLFLTCLKYIKVTFDFWFKSQFEASKKNEIVLYVIEYIIDNKGFEFVDTILPIVERIVNKTHIINMKLEESLINHIDNNEIGKLCLITSFMATELMTTEQFYQSLKMYNEASTILEELYQSDLSDQMTRWIIESIWASLSQYFNE